jgi:hypothetical protein
MIWGGALRGSALLGALAEEKGPLAENFWPKSEEQLLLQHKNNNPATGWPAA